MYDNGKLLTRDAQVHEQTEHDVQKIYLISSVSWRYCGYVTLLSAFAQSVKGV